MKGRLEDMAVADLIQHNCQDRKTARVQLKNGGQKGDLFFKNGNVIHASLGKLTGEEAVYELMNWEKGTFDLVPDVEPPSITVTRSWTSLLLEAARLSDETAPEREKQKEAERTAGLTRGEDEKFVEIIQEFSVATPQQLVEQISKKIEGHHVTCLTQIRGSNIYWYSSNAVELEELIEQVNQFVKIVNTAATRLKAGKILDNLLITESDYLLVYFLGKDDFYLLISADKTKANLGTLRHLARSYSERFLSALKLEGVLV
jgi:hypothetical protein